MLRNWYMHLQCTLIFPPQHGVFVSMKCLFRTTSPTDSKSPRYVDALKKRPGTFTSENRLATKINENH